MGDPGGDPAVHPVRTLQAGPAIPGRRPSVVPPSDGRHTGGIQDPLTRSYDSSDRPPTGSSSRPREPYTSAHTAFRHSGCVGQTQPQSQSQPDRRGWAGEAVVTCAQDPPHTLHPRIARLAGTEVAALGCWQRSSGHHRPSRRSGLNATDQTWLQPGTDETQLPAPTALAPRRAARPARPEAEGRPRAPRPTLASMN